MTANAAFASKMKKEERRSKKIPYPFSAASAPFIELPVGGLWQRSKGLSGTRAK